MIRKILHLDLDAFYCAVEEQRDQSLIGKPFAVGGKPEERGVISSCSYAARQMGVRSAMATALAIKICPDLIVVPPRYQAYSYISRKVMEKLHQITHLVEQISIDEAFLDVGELIESGRHIAEKLQASINKELNLPCSIGIATNKLVAKIANDVGKTSFNRAGPPNSITVVPPGDEAKFLAPLPVRALWGIGPKTAERLVAIDIYTIGDLANCPQETLSHIFGKVGGEFSRRAKGIDERPIITYHEPKSISQEVTFAQDISNGDELRKELNMLSTKVSDRLRKSGFCGATVKLKLRWKDFSTISRQKTLGYPIDKGEEIYNTVLGLFHGVWKEGCYVRLLGVGVSGLRSPIRQLGLWDDLADGDHRHSNQAQNDMQDELQCIVDDLRKRFGSNIIRKASDLKVDTEKKPERRIKNKKGGGI